MPGLLPLCIFAVTLTFFVGGYFFSSTFYFKKHDVKYSFTRMFPYEFNYPNAFKNNIYGNIAFIISIIGTIAFYICYLNTQQVGNNVPSFVLVIVAFLISVTTCCLLFMPLQFLRMHIMMSTLTMTCAFAMPALACCIIYPQFKDAISCTKVTYLVAFIIGAVMSLAMLIFLLNPRATYKIYMDKSEDKDGNIVMTRPKFIPMAFNEWWAIFTFILSPIPLLIISFIA